jgi:RNA polymerase sigma-70 factor (ECF subfamily)
VSDATYKRIDEMDTIHRSATMPATTEQSLLAAARRGDETAFARLTRPYRHELHLHCYRMLGSPHDAEDALQETLLRAWRQLASFEERAALRTWLYRIATNVCLRALERRPPPLLPYPDDVADVTASQPDPHASAEEREAVELAYLALLRRLAPRQRAAFVLREALDCSPAEIAELLDTSRAAVNSALQRARATLEDPGIPWHRPASGAVERHLVDEFMRLWADVDIAGLTALLTRDAVLTMPPEDIRIDGAEAIAAFFATVPADGRLDEIRLRPTRANGQPALAAYLRDRDTGEHGAYGIMVLTVEGDRIAAIAGFPGPEVFGLFNLPGTLD